MARSSDAGPSSTDGESFPGVSAVDSGTRPAVALYRRSQESVHQGLDETWPRRHRVAEPVGRRQPDEGENRDYPEVVGKRRALIGPEERAVEDTAGPVARRRREAVQHEVGIVNPVGHCQDGERQNDPQYGAIRFVNAPIMKSTMRSGRSMNPTLHFSTSDSARARA